MVLGINVAVSPFSICILTEDNKEFIVQETGTREFTETLIDKISSLCEKAGGTLADLKAVGVVHGPGAYTGLRIGVVTAKSLGQSYGIPIYSISTLEAIALSHLKTPEIGRAHV